MRTAPLISNLVDQIKRSAPELVVLTADKDDLFGDGMASGAIFSPEDLALYRYMLWRTWDADLPVLVIIMLNPSTADDSENDKTISTIITRAIRTGHGSILVINIFAWRATSPADMKKVENPKGIRNDMVLDAVLEQSDYTLLCAWGVHGSHLLRSEEVRCKIQKNHKNPMVLKMTKDGEPEHPLYKKHELEWFAWPELGSTSSSEPSLQ